MALSSPLPLIVAAPSPTALRANRRLLMVNGLSLLGRSMSLISTAPCLSSWMSAVLPSTSVGPHCSSSISLRKWIAIFSLSYPSAQSLVPSGS